MANMLDSTICFPITDLLKAEYQDVYGNPVYPTAFVMRDDGKRAVLYSEIVLCAEDGGLIDVLFSQGWRYVNATDLEQEIREAGIKPIMVGEFVKSRRGYNARLQNNEWELDNWLAEGITI